MGGVPWYRTVVSHRRKVNHFSKRGRGWLPSLLDLVLSQPPEKDEKGSVRDR